MRGLLVVGMLVALSAPAVGASARCADERAALRAAVDQAHADQAGVAQAHRELAPLSRELRVAVLQMHKGDLYIARLGGVIDRLDASYAKGCAGAALRGDCGRKRERLASLGTLRQRSIDSIPAGAARVASLEASVGDATTRLAAARSVLVADHAAVVAAAQALAECRAG